MANQQHIEWLLEGAVAWNWRREDQDFEPDFSAANIPNAFLETEDGSHAQRDNKPIRLVGVNLKRAHLSNAILGDAVLINADLQRSRCFGAYLYGANLSGSRLENADLTAADLAYANLAGAKLEAASLSRADLTGVDFTNIDLGRTNLDGANLTGVQPVELLFKPSQDDAEHGGNQADYRQIITIDPHRRFGKPCIRGTRITVGDIFEYLASGMTQQEILSDFPELTTEVFLACFAFAAARERRLVLTSPGNP